MLKRVFIICVLYLSFGIVYASDFTIHKLPNGQTLIVQEVKTNPIVTIDTWVKTGSINENDKNNGVSHFLEHLFFKGTKIHPAGEFDKILESKGANVNAATSKDFTHYYITLPSEYFDKALELHADMLMNPQIPPKELEKERKVVLEEISKDGNTPSRIVYENLNELMYTNHPYKRKVIGTSDIISKIKREEILEYFNKYYSPANMTTIVVGDVDTNSVKNKVSQAFNADFKKNVFNTFKKERPLTSQKRKQIYLENSNTGYMMIGFRSVPMNDLKTYAFDLLSQILGGGKSSRLNKNLKEQKGLVYSISSGVMNFRDDGIFYVSTQFEPKNLQKTEKLIFEEIYNIGKYGVTEDELNTAKKMIEQDTYYSRESISNIASELGYTIAVGGSPDIYKNYIANINKVTAKDIQKLAQEYLMQEKSAVSIALPKSAEISQKKFENKKYSAQLISESKGLKKYKIENNSTLITNKHDNNDIVAISIIAKGGEFLENKIGESTLLSALMLKGTQKYSEQELAQIMDENGIKMYFSAQDDAFTIDVQTTKSNFDLAMELLDEILNNSLYDSNEIEKKKTEILGKIKQRRDVPMNIASENYNTYIYENSVYSHTNAVIERNISKVERNDILSYSTRIFNPENIVVSVNGNVDDEKIIQAFGKMFKNKNQPKFNYNNFKVTKLNSEKIINEKIKDLQTAWIFIGWQTAGFSDKKDFVTLKVINTLLGGGMSSRIFRNLREQDGLAYQLGARYVSKVLGGNFFVYAGTNPETLNYTKKKLFNEIESLKSELVSDAELNSAKDRLKGSFVIALETNSDKANVTAKFEASGLGYDFLNEYLELINSTTASDIIRVANKYFNNIYVESSISK